MVKEISQLFPRFTRDARNDYETYKGRYDTALEKTVVFQDTLVMPLLYQKKCICYFVIWRKKVNGS